MIRSSSMRQHIVGRAVRSLATLESASSSKPIDKLATKRGLPTTSLFTTLHHQQRRYFLFDAFSSRNPILDLAKNPSEAVDFADVSPTQLIKAATQVETDYDQAVESFSIEEGSSAKKLLEKLQALEAAPQTLRNLAVLLYQMHVFDESWIKATKQVPTKFAHQESVNILQVLQTTAAAAANTHDETTKRLVTLQVEKYKKRGVASEDRETWDVLTNASLQLEARFLTLPPDGESSTPSSSTKEQLQDLYTLLSVKQKQAELLGYKDYVDMSLDGRMMQRDEIEPLLDKVAARAQTAMDKHTDDDTTTTNALQDVDVTPYLSLDGTLLGLFALSRALFGIVVTEDTKGAKGWHQDVRLFHVSDSESKESLGSFYLDPFRRPTKSRTTFMGPMTLDTVYINTNVRPPIWDDMATPVELHDVVSLFHEFGHVLQFLLATPETRVGLEDNDATLDVSEIVPQFMEHWVFQKSILQTLAHFSGTTIPQEVIQQAQEQRRHAKIDETLRRVFLGRLELEIFSPERKDDESLVSMQRRLSEQYVSHDLLPKSDLSPMAQLVEANGTKPVAQYRYLLSELISADIFHAFQEAGPQDQDEMKKLGRKFKDVLLKPGVAVNGYEALKELRGHDIVSTEAFFRLYKL